MSAMCTSPITVALITPSRINIGLIPTLESAAARNLSRESRMIPTIEIADRDTNGILTVSLLDLLALVDDVGPTMNWAILELEGAARLDNLLGLEAEIASSPKGKSVGWQALVELAGHFDDVFDATIVAFGSPTVPGFDNWGQLPQVCDIVIEAIDSSVWRISAHDAALVDRIAAAYHQVSRL
jgi:hypothetical protein